MTGELILFWKKQIFIGIFFGFMAIALLSPIASNVFIPDGGDYGVHTSIIMQAKMALQEGQIPIRIAPWQHEGWGNAFFQFYSPLPAMIGGTLYRCFAYFHFSNPFVVFKCMMGFALFLGGIYFFRLAYWLSASYYVALLSSVVYITAPYFLININVRGALSEAFAQGLVPLVLYYTLKGYKEDIHLKSLICIALSWFALLTTHLITFTYTSFFLGLWLIILFTHERTFSSFVKLMMIGLAYAFACLLAAWYLLPLIFITKYLFIQNQLINPFITNWLTPLSTLLSATAVNPVPHSKQGLLDIPLAASVGWPIISSVGVLSYLVFQKRLINNNYSVIILSLLVLFLFALFTAWSPFDFWHFLPKFLVIAQFSYRLLTQTMWMGALLFTFALLEIFKDKLDARHMIIGIFLIGLATSSWLSTLTSNTQIESFLMSPSLGYPASNYLVNPDVLPNTIIKGNTELPLVGENGLLIFNKKMVLPTHLIINNPGAILYAEGEVLHKNKVSLTLEINDHEMVKKIFLPGKFIWKIPIGKLMISKPLQENMSVQFLSKMTDVSDKPEILVKSFRLTNLSLKNSALSVAESKQSCIRKKAKMICDIHLTEQTPFLQLPMLYYPRLLNIKVNGRSTDYIPLRYRDNALVGLQLKPNDYHITMEFIGLNWSNWLSAIAWMVLLIILIFVNKQKIYRL
jgi:hypothetical protein